MLSCLEQGAHGVMVGRSWTSNPWYWSQVDSKLFGIEVSEAADGLIGRGHVSIIAARVFPFKAIFFYLERLILVEEDDRRPASGFQALSLGPLHGVFRIRFTCAPLE